MKIRIDLKDPDGVYESKWNVVNDSVKDIKGLTREEREDLINKRMEEMDLSPWVRYGEYVSIEIDTENNTAIVLRQ